MSEYQYYEFQAVDNLLSQQQQMDLRGLSSRARINATSFVNHYNYGDLHAEPNELIEDYFDAFVYTANWGSAVFSVKIPKSAISKAKLSLFVVDYIFEFFDCGSDWILSWSIPENDNYDRFAMESGEGWMARLLGLREELMAGDLRSLYLGWLCGVTYDEVDGRAKEPMVLAGLAQLTGPQKALSEFIEIDPDLLIAAATGSPALKEADAHEVNDWLNLLSKEEATSFLKSLFYDSTNIAQAKLKREFRQRSKAKNGPLSQARRS